MNVGVRKVHLSREGEHFRLAFPFDPEIVTLVKALPFAAFDPDTKSWTVMVCRQSVDRLREMYYSGLLDRPVDELVGDDEELSECPPAMLRPGSVRRPFVVATAWRDDALYARFKSVPGATWDKKLSATSYGPDAAPALQELVELGVLADPNELLSPAETTVAYDVRTGTFVVFGDSRAKAAFDAHFPERDVMAAWRAKGLDVAFSDDMTAEVYAGELERVSAGFTPAGLKLPLFEYQARSVALALARRGLGVFHSPGLGKTAVGVAAGHELVTNRKTVPRVVVMCPGAVRTQWALEIERFTGDTQDQIAVVDGGTSSRTKAYQKAADAKWLIVHYDVLHRDYDQLAPLVRGAFVVADEAHKLKSPEAKRSKAARKLASAGMQRIALSGTPVESVPDEWYWVLSFAAPNCLGGLHDFLNRYMYKGRFGGYEGARNLDELKRRSQPHYIRYTKAEVATHLPPLRVQHMPLDPDPAYTAVLKRAHQAARDEIAKERRERALRTGRAGVLDGELLDDLEAGAEMTAVGMLRALCSSPRLVLASDSAAARALRDAGVVPDQDGPKLDELRTIATEMQRSGERLVVFTYSKTMVDLIAQRFDEDGVRYVRYTGDTSSADRETARRRFTDPDDDVTVFVATDAAAEGLNLGKCCSTLVNIDVPWTPTRLEQRSNRIHRIDGTAPSYLVINMTVRGTVEEGILRMVENKADLADSIFGESGGRARTTGRADRRVPRGLFDDAMAEFYEEELPAWEWDDEAAGDDVDASGGAPDEPAA
jgi:superfamily II DNA or RNA helicase